IEHALAARHRNRGASKLALALDHDGLLVATCCQRKVRVKSRSNREDLKNAAAGTSFNVAIDVSGGFVPRSRNHAALSHDVAGELEFVAVARAGEGLLQTIA